MLIISASPHGPGLCTFILTLASLVLCGVTLPFSLIFCLKVTFLVGHILFLLVVVVFLVIVISYYPSIHVIVMNLVCVCVY